MKKSSLQLLIVFSIVLLFQISAFSQTSYTLHTLITMANKLSETIKIAEEDVQIAVQDKKRALAVLVPSVTTYGAMTKYKHDEEATPDTMTVGIKLTQSFTLNGKELIAFDVTKKTIQSREFSLESIRSQYLLQVSQGYYNILSAEKFLEIAESDVIRLKTHRDAVKEKLNVGNVTKTDLFRAEAELSKSKTELVKAQNGILQYKAALLNLVNIDEDFELEKEQIPEIENFDTSLEKILSFASTNRSEIKEAKKNLEIARKTIKFKKSDYWPSVSLEAGYRETEIEYDASPTDIQRDNEDLYITGQLNFTLYDGGLRRAQIRQARSEERKAVNALRLTEKKVILDSNVSFLEYQTAKSTLVNLQDELKSAQENFNAVQMQFKYGMADSIDMMDANTLLVSAQRRISDARYILYKAVLKIMTAKGDLTTFLLTSN